MSYDDPNDEEDWYDKDEDAEDTATGRCPECSGPVYEITESCPACGHWLTAADRRQLWSSESKPKWVLITAAVILAILVLGALTLNF